MKQKTSYFNTGLCRSFLKRCWPLWTSYFALLLLILPAALPSVIRNNVGRYCAIDVNCFVLTSGQGMLLLSAFVCIAAAMVMYSFMYSPRACGAFNVLPMRRETLFATAYLTGLVPLLMADVLAVGITWLLFAHGGIVEGKNLALFLAYAVMGNVAFFGFASFCAVLTGNLLILPAVYFALNLAASLAQGCINGLLRRVLYGFIAPGSTAVLSRLADKLSPIAAVGSYMSVESVKEQLADGTWVPTGEFIIKGTELAAVYCAAGIALAVCALLIYRKRDMERAGDVVAIPALKPVFKYCMAFYGACVFADVVTDWVGADRLSSMPAALLITALLLVGAFIGYFAARMLMMKTVRVFSSGWRGFAVTAALFAALMMATELDLFGYERRIPEESEIESVSIMCDGRTYAKLDEQSSVAAVTQLHSRIVADKRLNDGAERTSRVGISYRLKDGRCLSRDYSIAADMAAAEDPASDIHLAEGVLNMQEAVDQRLLRGDPDVNEKSIVYAHLTGYYYIGDEYKDIDVSLTREQAYSFYTECVLPDARDSSLGRERLIDDEEYFETVSNVAFEMEMDAQRIEKAEWEMFNYYYYYPRLNISLDITLDARRCLDWIEENTSVTPISKLDADPTAAEYMLADIRTTAHTRTDGVIGGADGPTAIFVS